MKIKEVANDIVNYASINGFSAQALQFAEAKLKQLVIYWDPALDPLSGIPAEDGPRHQQGFKDGADVQLELPLEKPVPLKQPKKG